MIFAMVFKVYSTETSRIFMSDLRAAYDKGLIGTVPHFNSISNYMGLETLKPIVKRLIRLSSAPVREIEDQFAADSTGLSIPLKKRTYDERKKRSRMRRATVKLHAMCGARTHIITSAEVSAGEAGDSPFFRGLLEETARDFEMLKVFADGAYTGNENRRWALIWGAEPYIAFKSNSVMDGEAKSALWKRMLQQFQDKKSEFWQYYYTRNNIEATFSMTEARFGNALKSKSFTAQVNEGLCMVLAHNLRIIIKLMFELGIEPDFHAATEIRRPANLISEQELIKVRERLAALTVKQPSFWECAEGTQHDAALVKVTGNQGSLPQTPAPEVRRGSRKKKANPNQLEMFHEGDVALPYHEYLGDENSAS